MSELPSLMAAVKNVFDAEQRQQADTTGVCAYIWDMHKMHSISPFKHFCRYFDGLLWVIALMSGSFPPGVWIDFTSTVPGW